MQLFTARCFVFQLELRHLSEEAERNATNPYPIYTAVERELTSEEPKNGTVTSLKRCLQHRDQGARHDFTGRWVECAPTLAHN